MEFDIEQIKKDIQAKTFEYKFPDQLVDDWKDYISDENKGLTTGISSFDQDLRGRLRGKVGAYIGYGGTKKSLLALQSIILSVKQHGAKGIYSTMEMPSVQLLERIIDMAFDADEQASYSFEKMSKTDKAIIEHLKVELKKYFKENLAITQNSRMTPETYRRLIEDYTEKHGKPDILIVDGLSMMGGVGSETESYTVNSGELKDLAKEFNIYIVLMCHLSKGAEKHTREVQRFVRGSEKILDNVDFIIQLSLIKDEMRSIDNAIVYRNDLGWVRFYNKRGSGKVIDKVYEFSQKNLRITETQMSPADFEAKEKQVF